MAKRGPDKLQDASYTQSENANNSLLKQTTVEGERIFKKHPPKARGNAGFRPSKVHQTQLALRTFAFCLVFRHCTLSLLRLV